MSKARLLAATLTVTTAGLALLAKHEGDVRTTYIDPVGIPTVCAGHTRTAVPGQTKTRAECDALLKEDATYAGRAVARCTKVPVTQEQYDALVSFVFNVGGAAYCSAALVRKLNAGDCWGAAKEFNDEPQIDRRTGKPRVYTGRTLRDRATGVTLLAYGDTIKKWTTAAGAPLPGLIKRRADERRRFETGCTAAAA